MLFCKIYPQFQGKRQALELRKDMQENTCLIGKCQRTGINFQWKLCYMEKTRAYLFYLMQVSQEYLHLQQMSVHSRHMAKVDYFFSAIIMHVGRS